MSPTVSIGKMRGLQQCATSRGAFSILALDHRQNLRRALHPDAPDSTTDDEFVGFKRQVAEAVAPASTAVLLDPEFGAAQAIASHSLPGGIGLIVAVEATGYAGDPQARRSRILPGWSVAKAKRMGASAVKLLVYYHPAAPTAAEIESLVRQVADNCVTHDIALFLEPLSYDGRGDSDRRRVVVETARRLTPLGVDVLKAEFPIDIAAHPDEREWAEACAELTEASLAPWVLLSASVDFETYMRQVAMACKAGASGVAAGRAVWQEAVTLAGEARVEFLRGAARDRMARLSAACGALARPWTRVYSAPEIGSEWYARY